MGEVVPLKRLRAPGTASERQQRIAPERLAFIARVAATDPDLLACVELEMTCVAPLAPEDTAERIEVSGVEKVKSDVQLFHDLSDFEFKMAQNLCAAAIKERLGVE